MADQPIPPEYATYAGKDKSEKQRLMAASLAVPLPPKMMVPVLYYLTLDESEGIRMAAGKSISGLPDSILQPVLKEELPAEVLEYYGLRLRDKEALLEGILLNHATPDNLFIEIAKTVKGKLIDIIAENQERYLRTTDIYYSLKSNPDVLKSTIDRITQFLVLAGIIAAEEPSVQTIVLKEVDESGKTQEAVETKAVNVTVKENLNEEERHNLLQLIAAMLPGAKIQLALKGNKEARGYLIRDSNKLVSTAVMKSPKLNENEVAQYATLRSTCDDVIRMIATSPQWAKSYTIRYNLCQNPKTPVQYTAQFIKQLTVRDLAATARNKNISAQVAKMAKLLLREKRK